MQLMSQCKVLFLGSIILMLSACAANFTEVKLDKNTNLAIPKSLTAAQQQSIAGLERAILNLGPNISPIEAKNVAHDSVVYPMYLARKYKLIWPPSLHNRFVNSGLRTRGLCFEWTEDMLARMQTKHLRTLQLHWVVANKAKDDEHNSMLVTAIGKPYETGILLDPWRNSGSLYWGSPTKDPRYQWKKYRSPFKGR